MNEPAITFGDYLSMARRRLPLLLLIVVPLVIAVSLYAFSLPDTYRSTAQFRIDLEGPALDRLQPVVLTSYAEQYIGNLRQSVLSRDSLSEWSDEVRAYEGFSGPDEALDVITQVKEGTSVELVTMEVMEPGSTRPTNLITGFRLSFDSTDPVTAERVAQRLALELVEQDRLVRTERAADTSSFLQQQIDMKRAEIAELEGKVADFKELHKGALPETLQLNMAAIERIERELDSVQLELRNLEQDRIFRMAQLDQIVQRSASATELAELEREYRRMVSVYGPDHPDLMRIVRQIEALTTGPGASGQSAELARLESELAIARERYTEEHPDILSLRRRIEALRLEERQAPASSEGDPLYLQLRAQVNAIDVRMGGLRSRTRELRARLAETDDRMARMPQVELEFQALMRDLESARSIFRNLQDRLAVARQTEALESGESGARITLVQQAFLPLEPAGPARAGMILLAVIIGTVIGGMAAVGAEALDTKVRGRRDVLLAFGAPPLAVVPMLSNSVSRRGARRRAIAIFGTVLVVAAVIALMLGRAF